VVAAWVFISAAVFGDMGWGLVYSWVVWFGGVWFVYLVGIVWLRAHWLRVLKVVLIVVFSIGCL